MEKSEIAKWVLYFVLMFIGSWIITEIVPYEHRGVVGILYGVILAMSIGRQEW